MRTNVLMNGYMKFEEGDIGKNNNEKGLISYVNNEHFLNQSKDVLCDCGNRRNIFN